MGEGSGGGRGGGAGGNDVWAMDPALLRRMAAVRDAERGTIVQVRLRVGICLPRTPRLPHLAPILLPLHRLLPC